MTDDRPEGAFGALKIGDLADTETVKRLPTAREIDQRSRMPVREGPPEKVPFDQVNIKARKPVIDRFKRMATDYRSQGRLLEMLMDLWDSRND